MDGSTRARRLLDKNVARTVLDANAGHRAATALVFDRDVHGQIVFETMDWTHPGRKGYWARNKALIARSVPLEDALIEDPIQVMFNGGFEAMRVLADAIRAQAHARDRVAHRVRAPRLLAGRHHQSHRHQGARAGQLRRRARPRAARQVMAIGDNFNDLEMLEFAGTPVVMGNAVEPLKARGFHQTGDQDEAGVAQAIHAVGVEGRP